MNNEIKIIPGTNIKYDEIGLKLCGGIYVMNDLSSLDSHTICLKYKDKVVALCEVDKDNKQVEITGCSLDCKESVCVSGWLKDYQTSIFHYNIPATRWEIDFRSKRLSLEDELYVDLSNLLRQIWKIARSND